MKFTRSDGTNREPRPNQHDAFDWLEANWDKADVIAMQLPTGSGKSFIARAIQRSIGAHVIVPNNLLLKQMEGDYPDVNALKGAARYPCHDMEGLTCEDRRRLKFNPCPGCPYAQARRRARDGDDTFFNPISYYYASQSFEDKPPVLIVDEAHKLIDTLALICTLKISEKKYPFGDLKTWKQVKEWLDSTSARAAEAMEVARERGKNKLAAQLNRDVQKMRTISRGIEEYEKYYGFFISTERNRQGINVRFLNIEPLRLPDYLLDDVFAGFDKVVLLSATMLETDVKEVARKRSYKYHSADSVVPAADRAVRYTRTPFTSKTDERTIVAWIRKQVKSHGNPNTIVHCTYSLARRLKVLMPEALTHDKEGKAEAMRTFKEKGGIWLAPACSEGVDLPGDECRLNLIPVLPYQNIGSVPVKGRMRLFGRHWYPLETLKTFIQQVGRSNRGLGDKSVTICGDIRILKLINDYQALLPRSFINAFNRRPI